MRGRRKMEYSEFLKTKELQTIQAGFEADQSLLPDSLFDFQRDIVNWACRKGKCAIITGCGTGKSVCQLSWAEQVYRHTGKDVLVIAPLSVVHQTAREADKFGISEVTICRSQDDVRAGLNITNYEIVDHFDASHFVGVVLDECFSPDTVVDCVDVDGNIVHREIKNISVGDNVMNCTGIDEVLAVKRKKVPYAIRIGFNGKKVLCSPRHPFFTNRGWVCAKDIQKGDAIISNNKAMRILRKDFSSDMENRRKEEILRQIMLCEMENESTGSDSKSSYKGSSRKNREKNIGVASQHGKRTKGNREDKEPESYVKSSNESQSICEIEGNAPRTFKAWGKWTGDDITAAVNDGCIARELDCGITYLTGKETARIPNVLQSRLRELGNENCDRDRWELSLFEKSVRQEEGRKTGFFGVESFEVLEQGSSELDRYRDAGGSLYFYDLEIKQHPSFTINECLVHNSSILKSFSSKTTLEFTDKFRNTPYKLLCTATIAPNDFTEIGTSCEFLGIMSRTEMLATYFVHDSGKTSDWRLKKAGAIKFWEWFATWAIAFNNPSELGYEIDGYNLPELNIRTILTESKVDDYELFVRAAETLSERREARKESMNDRTDKAMEMVNSNDDQWLLWVDYNDESEMLHKKINGSIEIKGSDTPEVKAKASIDFANGDIRCLVSKPSIFGFGSNWQSCHQMIFCGLSDSYERFYQAVRRCWRFGQKCDVDVYIILSEKEIKILENIKKKQAQMDEMQKQMTALMKDVTLSEINRTTRITTTYNPDKDFALPGFFKEAI